MATSTDLDLAFSADPDLADPDLEVAPLLSDADHWQALLSAWLHQLAPELRRPASARLQPGAEPGD